MAHKAEHIWRYGHIDVIYEPEVDGGGMRMAPLLIDLIRQRFGENRQFDTVFEWCSGPAFIGFGLLADGLCDNLCLADVNRKAIECVNRTIEANRLHERVRAYVSDNLESVPRHERFDLVVGNPPSCCAINPAHPYHSQLSGNIRGHDPDWKVHAGFYSQVAAFLNPKARTLVLEVNLYDREVLMMGSSLPLDIRPEEPQRTFAEMMRQGGLVHIEDVQLDPDWPAMGLNFWVQIAEKRA